MKTKVSLIFLFLAMIAGNTMAQDFDQQYTTALNNIFAKVDKSKIATGLLADYGLQIVPIEAFNGIPSDTNYVSMDTWKKLYAGVFSSIINTNANLTLPATVFAAIDNTPGSPVPLAMMHFQYNKLNDNAVTLGLLKVVNNQIVEVAGAASPYLTKQLFAVAPQSLYFTTATASFVFKSALWFTNSGKTVQKLEVNFNNESGYKVAAWNATVSYTFSTAGQKTIYFRLTYTDGSSYVSRTNIRVESGSGSLLRSANSDNVTPVRIPIDSSSLHSGGTIQIVYASSNTTGKLLKPLIIAEGFDASGIVPGQDNTDIKNFLTFSSDTSSTSFGTIYLKYSGVNLKNQIDSLCQYDIVYLDYNKGTDDIRRNAKLFEQVIETVNARKTASSKPNVVMGLSMGGLVARYALRSMELAGKDHQTWKFISVDSPHKGANVPVCFQAMVRHLEGLSLKVFSKTVWSATDDSSLKGAINLLNSKAAKQMLIYQVKTDMTYDNNSEYTTFMQDLDSKGFPQQCQNIAITDGSGQGAQTFAPESSILDVNISLPDITGFLYVLIGSASLATNYPQLFISNLIPTVTHLNVTFSAKALPLSNKPATKIYDGRVYYMKPMFFPIFIMITIDITKNSLNSVSGMLPIDGAPGACMI